MDVSAVRMDTDTGGSGSGGIQDRKLRHNRPNKWICFNTDWLVFAELCSVNHRGIRPLVGNDRHNIH